MEMLQHSNCRLRGGSRPKSLISVEVQINSLAFRDSNHHKHREKNIYLETITCETKLFIQTSTAAGHDPFELESSSMGPKALTYRPPGPPTPTPPTAAPSGWGRLGPQHPTAEVLTNELRLCAKGLNADERSTGVPNPAAPCLISNAFGVLDTQCRPSF